jgi:hypothetical protein
MFLEHLTATGMDSFLTLMEEVMSDGDILDMINPDKDEEENTVEDDELDEFVEDNDEEEDNMTDAEEYMDDLIEKEIEDSKDEEIH